MTVRPLRGDLSVPGVRALELQDCPASAALHVRLLPHGFFAQLGARFLVAYHRSFQRSPHAVGLVAVRDGEVVGFLLGLLRPGAHGAHVLRSDGLHLAAAGALGLLRRPRLLGLFLRTRVARYARGIGRRLRPAPQQLATEVPAVLQHVAVDPACRQTGTGRALVRAFEEAVAEAGVGQVVLLTTPEEDGAPAFYRRLGYEEQGRVRGADGDEWLRYRRRV